MAQQKQEQDLNQLLKVRRDKLADRQANGKDPFQITKFNPVSYTHLKNSWIFHCKPGEIFQCNLYAVPGIDVDRRFPYGNSRWN